MSAKIGQIKTKKSGFFSFLFSCQTCTWHLFLFSMFFFNIIFSISISYSVYIVYLVFIFYIVYNSYIIYITIWSPIFALFSVSTGFIYYSLYMILRYIYDGLKRDNKQAKSPSFYMCLVPRLIVIAFLFARLVSSYFVHG